MTNLEDMTGLTYEEVKQMKKKLEEYIQTSEFNNIQGAGKRTAYRRVAVHLNHILSGFRMEQSNKYEPLSNIY